MQFPALLSALLTFAAFIAALPTGISFSEDLKTAIAQKRIQERDVATSDSLSEEKRAYQLEIVEVATFKSKRDFEPAGPESPSPPSEQMEERLNGIGNRFDPHPKPGSSVEN